MDEASGDGFAELDAHGSLSGEIRFHNGDESGFKARPWRLLQQPARAESELTESERGFPFRLERDSSFWLGLEASKHGTALFGRFADAGGRRG